MVIGRLRRESARAPQRLRLFLLVGGMTVWGLFVIGRLVQLQVMEHEALVERALDQQTRIVKIPPRRGDILTRDGKTLATSVELGSIYAHPNRISDPETAATVLAPAIEMPREELLKLLSSGKSFVYLRRMAPPRVVEEVRQVISRNGLAPNVWFLDQAKRYYPHRALAAQVIGHVNIDNIGMAGVEREYDDLVRGQEGKLNTMQDTFQESVGGSRALEDPTRGHDIRLTLDWTLQYAAEEALADAIDATDSSGGAVVAMDPRTGEILAMASYPTFNPNSYDYAMVQNSMNRAVSRPFEPGSVFKVITAAAALHEGVVSEEEMIDCQGGRLAVPSHVYSDWKLGFGIMPFRDVIANSSNVGTIKVCMRMSPETFYGWIRDFGFGSPTGIDLPNEAPGLLQSVNRWTTLSQPSMAFGQEISATPLQLATALSVIANGGLLVQPRILMELRDPDGEIVKVGETAIRGRVLSEDVAHRVAAMMEYVVEEGTGKPARIEGYRIAGKTSTAQQIDPETSTYSRFSAGFGGFLPVSDPRLVIMAVVDDPARGRHHGSSAAGPIFRAIAEAAVRELRLAPDAIQRIPAWVTDASGAGGTTRTTGAGPPNP